jgi:hypothetical protein
MSVMEMLCQLTDTFRLEAHSEVDLIPELRLESAHVIALAILS